MSMRSFADVERELATIRREIGRQRNEDRLIRQKLSHASGSSTAGLFYASNPMGDHGTLAGLADLDHPQYFYLAGEIVDANLYSGADFYAYSDAGSTVKARLYGSTGDLDIAGNLELQTDSTWVGLGPSAARTVYTTGSEASLRSAADLALYSSADTSTERLRLYGSSGNVDLDGDIEFQTDSSWIGLGPTAARAVFSSSGSETSLRSAADFAIYSSADTSTEKIRLDGGTGSVYVADDAAVGINAGPRLEFDSVPSPAEVRVMGGDLSLGASGLGIIHTDGNQPSKVLMADGTRYLPSYISVSDISDLSYATPGLSFGTTNSSGAANSAIRSDAQIALFSSDNPISIDAGDTGDAGSSGYAARRDHEHGVTSSSSPGASADVLLSTGTGGLLQIIRMGVGSGATNARLDVDQYDESGGMPAIYVNQADVSEPMFQLDTTIGVGNAIEAVGAKTLTATHFVKILLPGSLTVYAAVGTIA